MNQPANFAAGAPGAAIPAAKLPTEEKQTARKPMAGKWTIAILVLTFAFVLMPFQLWYLTTFSRTLTDRDIAAYFTDTLHPRRAQHALSQIADRMISPNQRIRDSATRWYPQVVKFSKSGSDELRVTAAWVMGQDNRSAEFHVALLGQLNDPNPMVRRNAALSLVRFGDPAGHDAIASMLAPYTMVAPDSGTLATRLKSGDSISPGTLVGRLVKSGGGGDVRSNVPGTIERWLVANGSPLTAGQPMLLVAPSPEMAWEALRALYLIGQENDLRAVNEYAGAAERNGIPQLQQQAAYTAKAISARSSR